MEPVKQIKWLTLFAVLLLTPSLYAGTPSLVKGTVKGASGEAAAGLTVKAFNKNLRGMNILGQAQTGARGEYVIRYMADGDITLVVHVFDRAGRRIHESRPVIHAASDQTVDVVLSPARPSVITGPIKQPITSAVIVDNAATAETDTSFSAKGTVKYANGTPAVGLTVKALHKTPRSVRVLGRAKTDDSGYYMIRYSTNGDVTLVVRVFDEDGRQLYESRPVMHAASDQVVDIALPPVVNIQ